MRDLRCLVVGQRVVARDAHNALRAGTLAPVPREWRDGTGSEIQTTKGEFPKVWVRFADSGHVVPWPAWDVFTDIGQAEAEVPSHQSEARP